MVCTIRRPRCVLVALVAVALAGCGGESPPRPTPPRPPGLGGLERSIDAARGAVGQSGADARGASTTSAGQ